MVLATAFFLSTRIENALWWGTSVYAKLLLFLIPCFLQSEDSNEASFLRVLTLINDMYRGKINKKMHIFAIFNGPSYVNVSTYYGGTEV